MDSRTSLTADMWAEWTSAAFETTSMVGEEIAGIVDGLSEVAEHPGEMVYSSGRLWVFRRLRFYGLSGNLLDHSSSHRCSIFHVL